MIGLSHINSSMQRVRSQIVVIEVPRADLVSVFPKCSC